MHRKRPLPEAFRGRIIAHRGLHLGLDGTPLPENSLAALRGAADLALPIELDVRLTADEEPIVFHDPDTKRLTGVSRWVEKTPYDELRALTLRAGDRATSERIPTLARVLESVGDVPIVLELKQETVPERGLERHVAAVLRSFAIPPERLIIESFNPFVLERIMRWAPSYHRVQLTGTYRGIPLHVVKRWLLRNLMLNGYSRPDSVAVQSELLSLKTISRLKRWLGYEVIAWTATTVEDAQALFDRGVDCVIADLDGPLIARARQTAA